MVETMQSQGDLLEEAGGLRDALEVGLRRVERASPDLQVPSEA
jgi:hypothetical protein